MNSRKVLLILEVLLPSLFVIGQEIRAVDNGPVMYDPALIQEEYAQKLLEQGNRKPWIDDTINIDDYPAMKQTLGLVSGEKYGILLEDYYFKDNKGVIYKIPAGFIFDGASIPGWAQEVMGHPFDSELMRAGLIHDYQYRTGYDKVDADKLIFDNLRKDGYDILRATYVWEALTAFGGEAYDEHQNRRDNRLYDNINQIYDANMGIYAGTHTMVDMRPIPVEEIINPDITTPPNHSDSDGKDGVDDNRTGADDVFRRGDDSGPQDGSDQMCKPNDDSGDSAEQVCRPGDQPDYGESPVDDEPEPEPEPMPDASKNPNPIGGNLPPSVTLPVVPIPTTGKTLPAMPYKRITTIYSGDGL